MKILDKVDGRMRVMGQGEGFDVEQKIDDLEDE